MSMRQTKLKVFDMTCTSCEKRIERTVKKLDGVRDVKADFSGQFAEIEYDDEICNLGEIKEAINRIGYSTENSRGYKLIGILIIAAAIVLLGLNTGSFNMDEKLANASYVVLFVVGLVTSLHCVGMCGGIMLSQTIGKESGSKYSAIKPALLYNLGRVTAYTILGGMIGAIGSVIALSLTAKAGLQLFAGVFMIIMGFNMAGFRVFRKIQIKLPAVACRAMTKPRTPLIIGLLNGFMPCGPLQTMQIYALGTGSALGGAISMFMFSLGTVPLMLTFGALSGLLSKGYTKKILKFSGILIIVLGLIMSNRGLALAGVNTSPFLLMANVGNGGTTGSFGTGGAIKATLKDGVQVLSMVANVSGYNPNTLYVKKGVPVKWVVNVEQLTGCNNTIVITDLKVQQKLQDGQNIIEFTPGNEDMPFSCWMGMKRGMIKVVDDLGNVSAAESNATGVDSSTKATAGTSEPVGPSIYGDDISKVPTDRLVRKAEVVNNGQFLTVKGIGYELEPLIMVVNKGMSTKITFDLTEFNRKDESFLIMNANTKEIVSEFIGKEGMAEIEFTIKKPGIYGIYLNEEELLGVIEAVDDANVVDLEQIRSKFLN
ncbi:sulfite exporter TauE/SafE family protein [Bacillus sp. FJAT-29814]|uniref:urease accessory protein UreH domain-containing protein n=1 Tax=Bacillus sp. FJAT-29814 TaxID=1729688 RepID=UPI0008334D35|nr:sulfite exporter TauE/SafE family protein [Bacillus sp. FJAT-29814]